jgi:hypothetical protein
MGVQAGDWKQLTRDLQAEQACVRRSVRGGIMTEHRGGRTGGRQQCRTTNGGGHRPDRLRNATARLSVEEDELFRKVRAEHGMNLILAEAHTTPTAIAKLERRGLASRELVDRVVEALHRLSGEVS